jgi:hypothetical protein
MPVIKKLYDTVDGAGAPCSLYWSDMISCDERVMGLFLRTYGELLEKGHGNPTVTWTNKNRVVWAERDGKVLAGIVYDYWADTLQGWIVLSFTAPEERGKHLQTIVQNAVEADLKASGANKLCSIVHHTNIARLKAAERGGMQIQYHRMFKDLTK